jgi:hypothetical protein
MEPWICCPREGMRKDLNLILVLGLRDMTSIDDYIERFEDASCDVLWSLKSNFSE